MKTSKDPRHLNRIKIMQELFAWDFSQKNASQLGVTQQIQQNLSQIDKLIKAAAPTWPIDKINKIDLAILRLAAYELMTKETPEKVVVDEAIELAKEYGSDASPKFVNGALGKMLKDEVK